MEVWNTAYTVQIDNSMSAYTVQVAGLEHTFALLFAGMGDLVDLRFHLHMFDACMTPICHPKLQASSGFLNFKPI
jgi:hypothetical protein